MRHVITAALAACALFTATGAAAEVKLLDRQIVAHNGTPLGTLYLLIDTDEGARDYVFAVMDAPGMSFPPAMDFVVLAPNLVAGGLDGTEALRQVNNWKLRQDAVLNKAVATNGCNTVYQKLFEVTPAEVVNNIYRPTNTLVALMGEGNACGSEGRLMWFMDAAETPSNLHPMPAVGDVYFQAVDRFGPVAAENDWYTRSWQPAD